LLESVQLHQLMALFQWQGLEPQLVPQEVLAQQQELLPRLCPVQWKKLVAAQQSPEQQHGMEPQQLQVLLALVLQQRLVLQQAPAPQLHQLDARLGVCGEDEEG